MGESKILNKKCGGGRGRAVTHTVRINTPLFPAPFPTRGHVPTSGNAYFPGDKSNDTMCATPTCPQGMPVHMRFDAWHIFSAGVGDASVSAWATPAVLSGVLGTSRICKCSNLAEGILAGSQSVASAVQALDLGGAY